MAASEALFRLVYFDMASFCTCGMVKFGIEPSCNLVLVYLFCLHYAVHAHVAMLS